MEFLCFQNSTVFRTFIYPVTCSKFKSYITHQKTVHPGRSCKYGGDDEYWVETRETGLQQQERVRSEKSTEITKDRFCFMQFRFSLNKFFVYSNFQRG